MERKWTEDKMERDRERDFEKGRRRVLIDDFCNWSVEMKYLPFVSFCNYPITRELTELA